MSLDRIEESLRSALEEFRSRAILKSDEKVIIGILRPQEGKGLRFLIEGFGHRPFLRMNSNSYLGLNLNKDVISASKKTTLKYGIGPGAGRSLSGTYDVHFQLESRLAEFHGKEAGMVFHSAYSALMGTLYALASQETIVLSDELNHNCIINGIRMSRAKDKIVYKHVDMAALRVGIKGCMGRCRRVLIVTDGIFSMKGIHAPVNEIAEQAEEFSPYFEEGIVTIVDDSHGVGAYGATGRGTLEKTNESRIDILAATLGKAMGVNGGYVVSSRTVVSYLKETAPFYVFSNCISPGEASAAIKAFDILDSPRGKRLLEKLRELTLYFRERLADLGYEVIPGEHPIVPLMIRDTKRTIALVKFLQEQGVFAAGIFFPIVPKGQELIRLQVSADHTKLDLDYVLEALRSFKNGS